jgi:hypothetical protein
MPVSRRTFFALTPAALIPLGLRQSSMPGPAAAAGASPTPLYTAPPDIAFPSQSPAVVREMVIASHGNLPRVRELVGRWPALSRAAIDWGYGDWEDALGAASHTGRREIAELLVANGARPTLFSAAMLGQLDVVKAHVAASPGVEAVHGPHSITLLQHAMAGGTQAKLVADYLKTLPGSDRKPTTAPISTEELTALAGTYTFGLASDDKLVVELSGQSLSVARPGRFGRGLTHIGDRAFYPMGATAVRIRFATVNGKATVSVFDPDLIVTAEKLG